MKYRNLILILSVAFLCGCVLFLFYFKMKDRRSVMKSTPESGPPSTTPHTLPKPQPPPKNKLPRRSFKPADTGKNTKSPTADRDVQTEKPPQAMFSPPSFKEEKFSSEDLEDNQIQSMVYMDIGNYDVVAGASFTLKIRVTSPALANFSLMMAFDPEYLEYIDDSFDTVGDTFRDGVEFYAKNDRGEMIVISSGFPGTKHIANVIDQTVLTFQMRAIKAGTATISAVPKGIICLDPFGERKDFDVEGGEVRIW